MCQRVPGALASYVVRCSGGGAGAISFCDTADCSACGLTRTIDSPRSCVPNDEALFGSASYSIKCPSLAAVEAVPGVNPVRDNGFVIQWSGDRGCGNSSSRSLVIGTQGVCQRVPAGAPGTGYKVTCDADASGRGIIH